MKLGSAQSMVDGGKIASARASGSSAVGASRPPSKKRAGTSAWKPSGNGRTWPSCAPHPRCSACSHSSRYGQRSSKPRSASCPSVSGGIQNTRQPSAMPWPSSAVNSGPRRFSQAHRITQTRRNSQPTCSTAFCSSPVGRPNLQSQAQMVCHENGLLSAFGHAASALGSRATWQPRRSRRRLRLATVRRSPIWSRWA